MPTSGAAEILLRYDDDQERQHFETLFGKDFAIQAFASDQTALDHLVSAYTLPAAIVMIPNQPEFTFNHLQVARPTVLLISDTPVSNGRMAIYLEAGIKAVGSKDQPIQELIKTPLYIRNGQVYISNWRQESEPAAMFAYQALSGREREVAQLMASRYPKPVERVFREGLWRVCKNALQEGQGSTALCSSIFPALSIFTRARSRCRAISRRKTIRKTPVRSSSNSLRR